MRAHSTRALTRSLLQLYPGHHRLLFHDSILPAALHLREFRSALLNWQSLTLQLQYIPIFYQVTRQASATDSGINLLPFMLAVVLSVIICGQLVGRIGRYWPFLVCGPPILAIGSGLLYTVSLLAAGYLVLR